MSSEKELKRVRESVEDVERVLRSIEDALDCIDDDSFQRVIDEAHISGDAKDIKQMFVELVPQVELAHGYHSKEVVFIKALIDEL